MNGSGSHSTGQKVSRRRLLQAVAAAGLVGVTGGRAAGQDTYDWTDATEDAYYYSRYNAESLLLSGNGVTYPRSRARRAEFDDLIDEIRDESGLDELPIRGLRSVVIAPYNAGDPSFVERPVYNPRPVQDTLRWAEPESQTITPRGLSWTIAADVVWSTLFEDVGVTPSSDEDDFYAQLFGQTAQRGINYGFLEEEALRDSRREDDESADKVFLVREYDVATGEATSGSEADDRPIDYLSTLWALSLATAFVDGGALGYDTPEPAVDEELVVELTDMVARTVVTELSGSEIVSKGSVRDLGTALSAVGWYVTQGDDGDVVDAAEEYADSLVSFAIEAMDIDGRVGPVDENVNQAAVQGAVGQGLLLAEETAGTDSEVEGELAIEYLLDNLWQRGLDVFDDERPGPMTQLTVRDAGDIVGGLNAADEILNLEAVEDTIFPSFFRSLFIRGRLQRAERSESRDPDADFILPLPANAGGQFGQAPVYNTALAYDLPTDRWEVANARFSATAMYLATQSGWIGSFEGDTGDRGIP
ncbi:hypothetical protein [Halostella sp. PRR32]|uniref:hypothetical protein n=1 Tax=Halostella sp. PRR32 TaxID=3098147 RepID=UPI002B1CF321|nr:hypothetical protein [Halostella sp. PRR32]